MAVGEGRGGQQGAQAPEVGALPPGRRGPGVVPPFPQAPALRLYPSPMWPSGLTVTCPVPSRLLWPVSSPLQPRPAQGPLQALLQQVLGRLGHAGALLGCSKGPRCPKAMVWEGTRSATGGGHVEGPHLVGQIQGKRGSLRGTWGRGGPGNKPRLPRRAQRATSTPPDPASPAPAEATSARAVAVPPEAASTAPSKAGPAPVSPAVSPVLATAITTAASVVASPATSTVAILGTVTKDR